ncbi:MAG: hypothetical protein HFG72_06515 [Hungatella sp.]|nr:hypothetical protein [Hungatella sp.]
MTETILRIGLGESVLGVSVNRRKGGNPCAFKAGLCGWILQIRKLRRD